MGLEHSARLLDAMEGLVRGGGIIGLVVLIWLLAGVLATWQRGYFQGGDTSCATAGTIALTVVAGPLNYAGYDPKVKDCHLPQPSATTLVPAAQVTEMVWS